MSDAKDKDTAFERDETPATPARKGIDYLQLGFWAALVIAGGAAGMALTWTDAVGPAGIVLVIALGMMALVLVFFVTSGDSATLVLGMMSTGGQENPGARVKIVWGLLVSGIAISLLLAGGVKAVQTATIVFALPFAVVILLMALALWRGVREDWNEEQRRDRAMRRRMRDMVDRTPAP